MGIFSAFSERLTTWYRGKYIPPPPNDPDSSLVFISTGQYEQPLLAKLLDAVGASPMPSGNGCSVLSLPFVVLTSRQQNFFSRVFIVCRHKAAISREVQST